MLILQYKTTFVNFALTASNVNYFQLALEILHISYCLHIPSFKVKLANRVKLFSAQMYYNFLSYKCGFWTHVWGPHLREKEFTVPDVRNNHSLQLSVLFRWSWDLLDQPKNYSQLFTMLIVWILCL